MHALTWWLTENIHHAEQVLTKALSVTEPNRRLTGRDKQRRFSKCFRNFAYLPPGLVLVKASFWSANSFAFQNAVFRNLGHSFPSKNMCIYNIGVTMKCLRNSPTRIQQSLQDCTSAPVGRPAATVSWQAKKPARWAGCGEGEMITWGLPGTSAFTRPTLWLEQPVENNDLCFSVAF